MSKDKLTLKQMLFTALVTSVSFIVLSFGIGLIIGAILIVTEGLHTLGQYINT